MRQKLALVVIAPPSASLRRMKGFSPVRISRFGSRDIGFSLNRVALIEPTLFSAARNWLGSASVGGQHPHDVYEIVC